MKYDKKDRTKILVLVAVLVAVWAVIGIRFAVLSARHKAELARNAQTQAGGQQQSTPAPGGPGAQPGSGGSPTLRLAALVAPVSPPTNDPFHPIIAPRTSVARLAPEPSAGRRQQGPETAPPTLPPMPGADSSGRSGDSLQLTGIIQGTPSTAVLRLGDSHFVVKEGDVLDNSLRVQKITKTTVTLRDGRTSYTLRIGG
jgi:hypothetical protein